MDGGQPIKTRVEFLAFGFCHEVKFCVRSFSGVLSCLIFHCVIDSGSLRIMLRNRRLFKFANVF